MNDLEKRLFDSRIGSFIETVHHMMQLGEELKQSSHLPINGVQYGEELDKHNDQMS